MLIQKWRVIIQDRQKAQSFVELAIVLPVLLLILLGLVEIAFFIARYLDVMDLTREAARAASLRDPQVQQAYTYTNGAYQCNRTLPYSFYYTSACVFAPPEGSAACSADPKFCGGLNPLIYVDHTVDDVLIEVFTVKGHTVVDKVNPPAGYWALSDHDSDLSHNDNWKKDCKGNLLSPTPQPYYTAAKVESELISTSPMNKGFVGVEFYYCYHQVLAIPFANLFVSDPARVHAYTIMPLPMAVPTPTPEH